ncbi:hypothetical protein LCGC14_1387530 [marine sediment metagenome]|uniref:Uncharacterized protein n=1 Tax=marine sediment metagenome TaxID=412755 RepID=A0A0F9N2G6_9ZZZZ
MAYAKTTWNSGAAPGVDAAELNNLETQYDQVFTDIQHLDVGGRTADDHHDQSHPDSDHSDLQVVVKAADETVNNNNTVQNDDHLLFTVVTNAVYLVTMHLHYTSPTGTPNFRHQMVGPAGTTTDGIAMLDPNIVKSYTEVASSTLNPGINHLIVLQAIVRSGGTGGTVNFKWAQQTATSEDTKLLEGSTMIVRKVA